MSKTTNKVSPEVRDRAVRMVGERRSDYALDWAALTLIARSWVAEHRGSHLSKVGRPACADADRLAPATHPRSASF